MSHILLRVEFTNLTYFYSFTEETLENTILLDLLSKYYMVMSGLLNAFVVIKDEKTKSYTSYMTTPNSHLILKSTYKIEGSKKIASMTKIKSDCETNHDFPLATILVAISSGLDIYPNQEMIDNEFPNIDKLLHLGKIQTSCESKLPLKFKPYFKQPKNGNYFSKLDRLIKRAA